MPTCSPHAYTCVVALHPAQLLSLYNTYFSLYSKTSLYRASLFPQKLLVTFQENIVFHFRYAEYCLDHLSVYLTYCTDTQIHTITLT